MQTVFLFFKSYSLACYNPNPCPFYSPPSKWHYAIWLSASERGDTCRAIQLYFDTNSLFNLNLAHNQFQYSTLLSFFIAPSLLTCLPACLLACLLAFSLSSSYPPPSYHDTLPYPIVDRLNIRDSVRGKEGSFMDQVSKWRHEGCEQENNFKCSNCSEVGTATIWLHRERRGAHTHYEAKEKCCRWEVLHPDRRNVRWREVLKWIWSS